MPREPNRSSIRSSEAFSRARSSQSRTSQFTSTHNRKRLSKKKVRLIWRTGFDTPWKNGSNSKSSRAPASLQLFLAFKIQRKKNKKTARKRGEPHDPHVLAHIDDVFEFFFLILILFDPIATYLGKYFLDPHLFFKSLWYFFL